MAYPVILVDSATGSDSAASGAGPSTALTGSSASTSGDGLTITLDGSPNLSGVLTDGSHVIFVNDTTSNARNFAKITAVDNSAKTVTTTQAFAFSLSGKTWAIGGKRASISSATTKRLQDTGVTNVGDMGAGWAIEMSDASAETIGGSGYILRRGGDQTDGECIIRGVASTTNPPIITFSINNNCFTFSGGTGNYIHFKDFEVRNSNATKTASVAFVISSGGTGVRFLRMTCNHATDKFWKFAVSGGQCWLYERCIVGNCASHNISFGAAGVACIDCDVYSSGGSGILNTNAITTGGVDLFWCRIYLNAAYGVTIIAQSTINRHSINGNNFDNNTSGGIDIQSTVIAGLTGHVVCNNIFSNHASGTAVNFTGSGVTAPFVTSGGGIYKYNTLYGNSADCNLSGVLANSSTLNPTYANAATGDFRFTNASVNGTGYHDGNVGRTAYRSYRDPGSMQHQGSGVSRNRIVNAGGV